jgi:hypothetical protein
MAKRNVSNKKKKEKVIYYDDNSTIADMSQVRRKGEQAPPPQVGDPNLKKVKPYSTAGDKWRTYFSAVKMMLIPMALHLPRAILMRLWKISRRFSKRWCAWPKSKRAVR